MNARALENVAIHARDSTGVLIESGSCDNQLIDNDCRHGGDGIFVRVVTVGGYAAALAMHLSGPIAMVIAGLMLGIKVFIWR